MARGVAHSSSVRANGAPVMMPCSGVLAPMSAATAEREKEPVAGYALNMAPKKLAMPCTRRVCELATS